MNKNCNTFSQCIPIVKAKYCKNFQKYQSKYIIKNIHKQNINSWIIFKTLKMCDPTDILAWKLLKVKVNDETFLNSFNICF